MSKFTAYDASKLFKLYRIACRKRDDQRDEVNRFWILVKFSVFEFCYSSQS